MRTQECAGWSSRARSRRKWYLAHMCGDSSSAATPTTAVAPSCVPVYVREAHTVARTWHNAAELWSVVSLELRMPVRGLGVLALCRDLPRFDASLLRADVWRELEEFMGVVERQFEPPAPYATEAARRMMLEDWRCSGAAPLALLREAVPRVRQLFDSRCVWDAARAWSRLCLTSGVCGTCLPSSANKRI